MNISEPLRIKFDVYVNNIKLCSTEFESCIHEDYKEFILEKAWDQHDSNVRKMIKDGVWKNKTLKEAIIDGTFNGIFE